MIALLVVALFAAVLIGTGIAFGGIVLAVLLALAALLVVAWGAAVVLSRRSAADVVDDAAARSPELLGPGGPDDPARPSA